MQAQEDAKRDAIAAGEMFVRAAWGDWHDDVPKGMVGALYSGKEGEVYILMPKDRYDLPGKPYPMLSEVADVMETWENHPGARSKRLA